MTEPLEPGHPGPAGQDPLLHGAATFIGQVLGIADAPDYLASDLSPIKRDANASIYSIQLDSSVGPAAFLVYAYVLNERGGDGRTGQELFETGLATLQQAAQRETPGPRAVAHAATDAYGFILATTPGTYRALTGDAGQDDLEATAADLIAIEDAARFRGETAHHLLQTLRAANQQATDWLQAVQLASQSELEGEDRIDDLLEFTEDETELALFLLDEDSIGSLLRALNLLVATAQQHTRQALDPEQG